MTNNHHIDVVAPQASGDFWDVLRADRMVDRQQSCGLWMLLNPQCSYHSPLLRNSSNCSSILVSMPMSFRQLNKRH